MTEQDTTESITRYQEIINAILKDVKQGVYTVGDRLPTEYEFCRKFEASRQTVREALRRLQEMGYIARRQGSGSILISRRMDRLFQNSITSLEQLIQYASTTKLEILSTDRIVVGARQAEELGCQPADQWFRISAVRRREEEDQLIGYTEIYVDVSFEEVVRNIGAVQTAVYEMIEETQGVKITEVLQSIEAVPASLNIASRLSIEPGSAVLLFRRRYFSEDRRLVQIAKSWHPGEHLKYEMTLRRK